MAGIWLRNVWLFAADTGWFPGSKSFHRRLLRGSWRRALASLALPSTAGTLHAQVPNPACYIPFDEGTGTVAHDAASTNNATLLGGAGWIKGIVGPFALSVPGTNGSYADIPADVVSTTQSFTVCARVNLNSVPGYQTFVSEDAGYQSAFFLQKRADTNTFTFTTNTGATSGPGTTVFADSGITPAAGTWYHVAGVYDASSGSSSVYVNGVLAGQNFAASPSPAVGHTGIGHGQYNNGYVDWVNGAIDDVRFYSSALSASQEGSPTPNLHAAIGDAAWLTGLERNSDIVIMESYAPLFVNINAGAFQWATNLIGYDALESYGSPAYYVQVMFANNHGNVALPVTLNSSGGSSVYASVTRNSKSGSLYVKVVNAAFEPQQVNFSLTGFNSIAPNGIAVLLTGNPAATNAPGKIQAVPQTVSVNGLGANFSQTFPAYSVTVLKISAKKNQRPC